jgi:hypothetical protein
MLTVIAVIFGIILFIALLIGSPAFRGAVIVFAVIAGIGIYLVVQTSQKRSDEYALERQRQERLDAERWTKMRVDEIEIRDATLAPSFLDRRDFVASVRNNGGLTLIALSLRIVLYDCKGAPQPAYANCETIGENSGALDCAVPPNQVRQVKGSFQFANTPPVRGRFAWTYEVRGLKAS